MTNHFVDEHLLWRFHQTQHYPIFLQVENILKDLLCDNRVGPVLNF